MKKLVSRTEFAQLAEVSAATVTRAALNRLADAVDGKYIDAAHPAAVDFIEKGRDAKTKKTETVPGVDPLYEHAVARCAQLGKFNAEFLKKEFNIGSERARKLRDMIATSGVLDRSEIIIPMGILENRKKFPHVRGTAAAKQNRIDADDEILEPIAIPGNIIRFADMTIRQVIQGYGTATRFVDYLKALKEIGIMAEREIRLAEIKGQLVSRALVQTQIVEQFDAAHMKLLRDGSRTIAIQVSAMVAAGETPEDIEKAISEKITDFIRPVKAKVARALKNE